jgi:hypothetical protein
MKEVYYTNDNRHPDDVIFDIKNHVNKLQDYIDLLYNKLCDDLRLNEAGKEWLFDYLYNGPDEKQLFTEFLESYNTTYDKICHPIK